MGAATRETAMNTLTSEKVQKERIDKKLLAAAWTHPDDHIHSENCVNRHINKHKGSDTASFIEQQ